MNNTLMISLFVGVALLVVSNNLEALGSRIEVLEAQNLNLKQQIQVQAIRADTAESKTEELEKRINIVYDTMNQGELLENINEALDAIIGEGHLIK